MVNKAAQMTMAATVWFAQNRSDLAPEVSLKLATMLGEVAEKEDWNAPADDFNPDADKTNDEVEAFLENAGSLRASVEASTNYPEELAAVLSSVANFMGWTVSA